MAGYGHHNRTYSLTLIKYQRACMRSGGHLTYIPEMAEAGMRGLALKQVRNPHNNLSS